MRTGAERAPASLGFGARCAVSVDEETMAVAGNLHSEQGREINAGYGNRIVRLKDGWMVDGQGRPMRAEGELLAEATA
jgi:hypothetical protein